MSVGLGSISAVFSSPVFDPPGVSAGSFPEQRLVIEPSGMGGNQTGDTVREPLE